MVSEKILVDSDITWEIFLYVYVQERVLRLNTHTYTHKRTHSHTSGPLKPYVQIGVNNQVTIHIHISLVYEEQYSV